MKTWTQFLEQELDEFVGILSKKGGWIEPDGTMHSCSPFSHVDELEKLPQFAELLKFQDKQKRWDLMMKRAYHLGFVRVVINSDNVYVEGKRDAIAKQRKNLKDLAASIGEDSKVVPTYR